MLILMNEHYRSRMYEGKNIGDLYSNSLYSNSKQWEDMINKISIFLSENHRRILNENSNFEEKSEYILASLDNLILINEDSFTEIKGTEKERYLLIIDNDDYEFKMTQDGYRYQFNGYMKSSDKANKTNTKIQWSLMFFTIITTLYYLLSWFDDDLDLTDIQPLLKILNLILVVLVPFTLNIIIIGLFFYLYILYSRKLNNFIY